MEQNLVMNERVTDSTSDPLNGRGVNLNIDQRFADSNTNSLNKTGANLGHD